MATRQRGARPQNPKGQGDLLRADLLGAAERLMVASGSRNAVTVAAVCESVGCTAPALYRHFADKQALVEAVCQRLFDNYAEAFERVVVGTDRAADRLHAFGTCYVDFAFANPGAYRVLFMHGPEEQVRPSGDGGPTVAMFRYLSSIVAAFLAESSSRIAKSAQDQVHEVACLCWSAVHGPVSLVISKPDFAWPGGGEEFARLAIRRTVAGLLETTGVAVSTQRTVKAARRQP